jgi:hypothetical protein
MEKEKMKTKNRKTQFVFRIKCMVKRCREEGKWDLLSHLIYKYTWINLTAGEAYYD